MNRPQADVEVRFLLYRRTAGALNRFYRRWTAAFCASCLEVMARAHPDDPRSKGELQDGLFPGCCQEGVAEGFAVWGGTEERRLSSQLEKRIRLARASAAATGAGTGSIRYTLREHGHGKIRIGSGCRHLAPAGCRLRDLKAPLCLTYLCAPVQDVLFACTHRSPTGPCGDEANFCGSAEVFRAISTSNLHRARYAVCSLNQRLTQFDRRLEEAGYASGKMILDRWMVP